MKTKGNINMDRYKNVAHVFFSPCLGKSTNTL